MRIVVDTNIFVSSFWKGSSREVIERAEAKDFTLILSQEIIDEFIRVLNYKELKDKIVNKSLEISRTIEEIISFSEIVEPKIKLDIVKSDPEDNKILECALEGKADFIISKDNDLLNIKDFRGIPIIKPDEFLEKFNKN